MSRRGNRHGSGRKHGGGRPAMRHGDRKQGPPEPRTALVCGAPRPRGEAVAELLEIYGALDEGGSACSALAQELLEKEPEELTCRHCPRGQARRGDGCPGKEEGADCLRQMALMLCRALDS